MPDATLGTIRTLTSSQVADTGTKMVVVNTFHLFVTVGVDRMSRFGGIRKFMNWEGKVLSDSGGFQVYSLIHRNRKLGKITQYGAYFTSPVDGKKTVLTPELSIDMQVAIGADVLIVLDDCRPNEISDKEAEESVRMTTGWAKRAKKHFESEYPEEFKRRKIFAVVQGGNNLKLRRKSAEELMEIGFDGYCFGGWPVHSDGSLAYDQLEVVSELMPDDKPKYAMGIGTPDDIRTCSKMGYSIFDCVLPTRNARHGLLYTSDGGMRISQSKFRDDENPVDKNCNCETCRNYSRAYIHHLFRTKEVTGKVLATIHNLTYYQDLMKSLSYKSI